MTPRLVAMSDRATLDAARTLERLSELGRLARPWSVLFQLRDLELPARERLAFGAAMKRVAVETEQRFVVNDRLDLASLLGADGVQLGEASVDSADARRLLPERTLISRASHDPALALGLDADLVLLSPILEARKGRPALGLDALERARKASVASVPPLLFALGGVDAAGAAACLRAGADGVAALGAVLGGSDLQALVRALDISR